MKIGKYHYLFFAVLSLLLLVLGISLLNFSEKKVSKAEYFSAQATIINNSHGPLAEDLNYYGQTIYASKPTLTLEVITGYMNDIGYITVVESSADYNNLAPALKSKDYNQGLAQVGGYIVNYSYDNDNYLCGLEICGKDDNDNYTYYDDLAYVELEDINEYFATMTLTSKPADYAQFYCYSKDKPTQYTLVEGLLDVKYGETISCSSANITSPIGQSLNGWKVGSSSGTGPTTNSVRIYSLTGNKFYAKYRYNRYTINFNANGGTKLPISGGGGGGITPVLPKNVLSGKSSFTASSAIVDELAVPVLGADMSPMSCYYGTTYTMRDCEYGAKMGYCFDSWNTKADGTGTKYTAGQSFSNLAGAYKDNDSITLYAQWRKEKYNMKFDTEVVEVEYGETITCPVATKEGFTFTGWKHSKYGTINGKYTIPDFGADGSTISFESVWVSEIYALSYYSEENGTSPVYTETVYYDSDGDMLADEYEMFVHTRYGYVLQYWQDSQGGQYLGTITVPDWGDASSPGEEIPVRLDAVWKAELYSIKYDSNYQTYHQVTDKTVAMPGQGRTYDEVELGGKSRLYKNTYELPYGYEFLGWSTDKNQDWKEFDATQTGNYTDEFLFEGERLNELYDYAVGNKVNLKIATIYAVWKPIEYFVVFNANGGTGTMDNQQRYYDEGEILPNNEFDRKNFLFRGWSIIPGVASPSYYNMQYITNELYPLAKKGEDGKLYVNLYASWLETWANQRAKPSGKGTLGDPYIISTPQELAWISWMQENSQKYDNNIANPYFKQTANINLSGYEWLPIGKEEGTKFSGNYDGNGYVITNIQVNEIRNIFNRSLGLFGYITGSSTTNSTLKNIRITSGNIGNYGLMLSDYSGAIVGYAEYTTLENCTNYVTVCGNECAGGIAGTIQNGSITSCYNYGDIQGLYDIGGIVGDVYISTIKNCYANCDLLGSQSSYLGGIASDIYSSTIDACAFEGYIYGDSSTNQSGIASYVNGTSSITNCYVNAEMEQVKNFGLGYAFAKATKCVMQINSEKYVKGNDYDFTSWVISSDEKVYPPSLSWLAIGGTRVTDVMELIALGYKQI